jgi:hypothetical protein
MTAVENQSIFQVRMIPARSSWCLPVNDGLSGQFPEAGQEVARLDVIL